MDAGVLEAVMGPIWAALRAAGRRAPGDAVGVTADESVLLGRRLLTRLCRGGAAGEAPRPQLEAAATAVAADLDNEDSRSALRGQVRTALAGADGVTDPLLVADLAGLLEAAGVHVSASDGRGAVSGGHAEGIIYTGRHAKKIIRQAKLPPDRGLLPASAVSCQVRVADFGPHTTGRFFVGRTEELAELVATLANRAAVVATPLGGAGKSALVRKYTEEHRDRYNPIWWVDAGDLAGIEAGLAALARRLYPDLSLMPDPEAAAWGRSWLACHSGWLVVLDNVNDPAHVAGLLNSARGGRFLLTSRLTTGWEGLAKPLALGPLTPDHAVELVARVVRESEFLEGAGELCEALGCLPLVVRMAAAYMRENNATAEEYLKRLTASGHGVPAWTPTAEDIGRTVARIWLVSLRNIAAHHGALPQELLRILAWYAPTGIPISLLQGLTGVSWAQIDAALSDLTAYALITREGDAASVHGMIQAASRHASAEDPNPAQAARLACNRATALLKVAIPPYDDPKGWPEWRRLLPHIDALLKHTNPQSDGEAMLPLLSLTAQYLGVQGQSERSIAMHARSLEGFERVLGPSHPNTLISRNNLAVAYESAGDVGRAIPLHERILADFEQTLGPNNPNTLISRNNLAGAYESAGDVRRAIALYEQTLDGRERVLGKDHPDTLTSRNNLAYAYDAVGDAHRAITLFEQTLEGRERVLGADHPATLFSRNNLARAYESAGEVRRAIPLHERTLAERERVLGPDYPATLSSRNSLAVAYQAAGDVYRAITLFEQTLTERERILGKDHPDTLISRNNLAAAFQAAGDAARAIPLFEQTLAARERILGPDDPDTLVTLNNLAYTYESAGDRAKAIPLYELALEGRERVLGADHPLTQATRKNLGRAKTS